MTLEKAIECLTKQLDVSFDYEQLLKWLNELKDYRDGVSSCQYCRHDMKASTEYPCNICKNNHPNMFEWRSKE